MYGLRGVRSASLRSSIEGGVYALQAYIIFEANTVEIIKREIAFHCLAKVVRGRKETGNDRGLHQGEDMTFLASPSLGSDPVAYAIHSMR